MREKEDLLKESRAKLSTMDNVKTQIDVLMKVWFGLFTPLVPIINPFFSPSRQLQRYKRRLTTWCYRYRLKILTERS